MTIAKDSLPRGHYACALCLMLPLLHCWTVTIESLQKYLHIFVLPFSKHSAFQRLWTLETNTPHTAVLPLEGSSIFLDLFHYLKEELISPHSYTMDPQHITSAQESYKILLCFKSKHSGYHLIRRLIVRLSLRGMQYPCMQISEGIMLSWLFNGEHHWGNNSLFCQGAVCFHGAFPIS